MNKGLKTFALVGLAACAIGATSALASCDNREKLVIWAAEEVLDLTKTQVDRFVKETTDFPYKVVYENVSESNAVSNVLNDVTAAGDIFFFANDQLARVVQSGALSPVPTDFLSDVINRNEEKAVKAGYVGETLYAYPVTNDNGYFAFYDSNLFTAEDMKTQEAILAKLDAYAAEGQTYTVSFELKGSGWYNFGYFFGAGANSEWYADDDGVFYDKIDTYNSDAGKDALLGMQQLMGSGYWIDNSTAATGFAGDSAIVVSGTWDTATVEQYLGENYAAAELWTVTVPNAYAPDSDDGSHTYHLGSFSGCKFVGVRNNEDGEKNMWAHEIANYLTDELCQRERFDQRGWGPSNIVAAADDSINTNPAIAALLAQDDYAQTQGQYPDIWWTATSAIGAAIQDAGSTTLTDEQLTAILEDYDATCDGYLQGYDYDYAVVGTMSDSSWDNIPGPDTGYALYELNAEEGTYTVGSDGTVHGTWNVILTFEEGDENMVRVVPYGEWSPNYGAACLTEGSVGEDISNGDDNIGNIPAGVYNLCFDYSGETPAITITAITE